MTRKLRRQIPKELLFVVKRNIKKIDFTKKYTFIYFDWWFELLDIPVMLLCWVLCKLSEIYFDLRVTGREHIRSVGRQGCITVSNHCHYFDTIFAGYALFPRRVYVSVVKRNFEVPYVRRILRMVRAFPIPPGARGFDMIVGPVGEALRRGHHVLFLPEGDLVYLSQEIFQFKSGAFRMAYIHQVPVLPMVYVLLPRRQFGKDQSKHWPRIRQIFGAPLFPPPKREDGSFPTEEIRIMMEKVASWMEETIASYHGTKTPQSNTGDSIGLAG
jgi:1-acyl-sn-glycerol-3-phosphate acyltransferase